MWNLFKKKKSGCLDGKTQEQKNDFFKSLAGFATTEKEFFKEQYLDLLPHEQEEFSAWILKDTEQKKTILRLVSLIGKISEK